MWSVSFGDGKKSITFGQHCKKLDTSGRELMNALERQITSRLSMMHEEHLRAMDHLKQSVRHVTLNKKDPW